MIEVSALLGVVTGWWLNNFTTNGKRKQRLKSHWGALWAEMELCKKNASALLDDNIVTPLYRLPTLSYQNSLPVLLADGDLSENQYRAIGLFFSQVEDINRGLDDASELYKTGHGGSKLRDTNDRNILKAEKLIQGKNDDPSLYEQAISVVNDKLTFYEKN